MSYTKTTNHAAAMSNSTSQVYTATPPAVAHDGSILERIAQATYKRIEEERKLVPDETLIKQAQARAAKEKEEAGFTFPFEQALAAPGISFICVLKKSFYGCSNYPECKFTLAEHFRKKKLTKTNVKELLEGKETLVNILL